MENEKRLYSINLGAYIIATTDLMPRLEKDEIAGTYYMVFPHCEGVRAAIKAYKTGNPEICIHDFLHGIKQIRSSIAAAQE